jgi:hypothetical protein
MNNNLIKVNKERDAMVKSPRPKNAAADDGKPISSCAGLMGAGSFAIPIS